MRVAVAVSALLTLTSIPSIAIEPMMDRMPILGDRTSQLERRIERLEKQPREQEKSNQTADTPGEAKPSAWLRDQTERANELMKNGDFAAAVAVHRESLEKSAKALPENAGSVADCFVASYVAAIAAEQLEGRKELELAKELTEAAVQAMHELQEAAPGWNPKIVKFRLDRTEAMRSRLK